MYKVTVTGTYVISGKLAQIDAYETEFKLAEGRKAEARAIIQNSGMLDEQLRKEKKSYKRWRTCQIIDITELKEKANSDEKTKKAEKEQKEIEKLVVKATNLSCMPVNYKSFASNKMRKEALEEAIEKKKAKIAKSKARTKGKKQETLGDAED